MSFKRNGTFYCDAHLRASKPICLIGGAQVNAELFAEISTQAQDCVAADGGANQALSLGVVPKRVWGDFDSISPAARAQIPEDQLFPIAEQDSTDFDKALRHISAPLIYCLGFTGERRDHELAACHSLVKHHWQRAVLVSEQDLLCLAPPHIRLPTEIGERVSLFPLGEVRGRSAGLRWPIDNVAFSPLARIGTSNHAIANEVDLTFDKPAMLLIMPRAALPRLAKALQRSKPWSGNAINTD